VLRLDAQDHKDVWRMRVWDPTRNADSQTLPLFDDLRLLQQSRDDFHFHKSKRRKSGWRCDEIAVSVFRDYGVRMGAIARGTRYIHTLDMVGVSPLDVVIRAYKLERSKSGRRYVMRWDGARMNITPLRRNPAMLVLGPLLQGYEIAYERKGGFATVVTARASIGNKKKRKIHVTVENKKALAKYGFVHRIANISDVDTESELRTRARRDLARRLKINRTVSVTHPGVATIRRGDGMILDLPDEGFRGDKALVYCTRVNHTISGGQYDMDIDLGFDDPYEDAATERAKKDAAARESKRKKKVKK
jgi:hypothetical protein